MFTCQLWNCFSETTNEKRLQEKNLGKSKEKKLDRTGSISGKTFFEVIVDSMLKGTGVK